MTLGVDVDFTANVVKFNRQIDKLGSDLDRFGTKTHRSFDRAGRSANKFASALTPVTVVAASITAATAAMGLLVSRSIEAGDKIQKLSIRLGASTEALSQLEHVANLSGVSFNTLTTGMQRMTRRVSEAANGTGEAVKALDELGLSAQALAKIAPEDQFELIAEKISQVEGSSDRVRLAMKLFDAEGVALLQTMENGASGIRSMRKEADELGLTLSKDAADAMADAKDDMARLESAFDSLALKITTAVTPALATFLEGLNKITGFDDSLNSIDELTKKLERYKKALSDGHPFIPEPALRKFIEQTEAELDKKRAERDAKQSPVNLSAADLTPGSTNTTTTTRAGTGTAKTATDAGTQYIENLKRQIALFDETGQAAVLRYETEEGRLKNVSSAQKELIIGYGQQIDALNLAKQEQEEFDDIVSAGVKLAREQQREIEKEVEAQRDAIAGVRDFIEEANQTELDQLAEHYETRKKIILENTEITELERQALLASLNELHLKQQDEFVTQQNLLLLSNAGSTFGELAQLTKTFAGEQSTAYKAMFAVSKAFAIAETTIKTYQAAQDAYASLSSIPYVGPALGAAAAAAAISAGLARVATISSQSLGGVAHGGLDFVPKESTFLLDRGERVLSPRQNTDLTSFLKQNGNGPNRQLYVNFTVHTADAQSFRSSRGKIEQELLSSVSKAAKRF